MRTSWEVLPHSNERHVRMVTGAAAEMLGGGGTTVIAALVLDLGTTNGGGYVSAIVGPELQV